MICLSTSIGRVVDDDGRVFKTQYISPLSTTSYDYDDEDIHYDYYSR